MPNTMICAHCGRKLRLGQYVRAVKTRTGYKAKPGGCYFLCRTVCPLYPPGLPVEV